MTNSDVPIAFECAAEIATKPLTKNCALREGVPLERSAALDILEELAIVAMVVRR